MDGNKDINSGKSTHQKTAKSSAPKGDADDKKIKTRSGSGYLKQLYSTARTTSNTTHSNLKNLTTFLVNFVPVENVDASELQVRTHFDEEEIKVLAKSIKEHGVLQPILVVQNGDRYKVVAGERRLRASKMAGVPRIPARVLNTDDNATHEIALRENLDRVDLHPIEEGEGYVSLIGTKAFTSHDSIAKAFLKPKSRITECIGFTKLPEDTKEKLLASNIKNRALLRQLLATPVEEHDKLIKDCIGKEEILINHGKIKARQEKKKKESKPKLASFEYKNDSKGVIVPLFRWKAGEGREKLEDYLNVIEKMASDLRAAHLTKKPEAKTETKSEAVEPKAAPVPESLKTEDQEPETSKKKGFSLFGR